MIEHLCNVKLKSQGWFFCYRSWQIIINSKFQISKISKITKFQIEAINSTSIDQEAATEEMKLIAPPPLTVAINFLRKKSEAINFGKQLTLGRQKTWKQLAFWGKSPANCFPELNCDQIRSTDSIFFRLRRAKIDIHFCIFTFKMLKIFACGGPKSISFIVFSPSKCYFFSPATD